MLDDGLGTVMLLYAVAFVAGAISGMWLMRPVETPVYHGGLPRRCSTTGFPKGAKWACGDCAVCRDE